MDHVDAIDCEIASQSLSDLTTEAHERGKIVIASTHDFVTTPPRRDLDERLNKAREHGADFIKFATRADHLEEYLRLREFCDSHIDENLAVMAMFRYGPLSRKQLPGQPPFGHGSRFTYGCTDQKAVVAGQVPYQELHDHFRRTNPYYSARFQ